MRRLIIGAVAFATGLAAAVGGLLIRRRRVRRDEVLPLDPVPPLGSTTTATAALERATATASGAARPARRKAARSTPRRRPAEPEANAEPSVEADFGSVDPPGDLPEAAPPNPKRPRTRRTSATAAPSEPTAPADAETP